MCYFLKIHSSLEFSVLGVNQKPRGAAIEYIFDLLWTFLSQFILFLFVFVTKSCVYAMPYSMYSAVIKRLGLL